MVAVIPVDRLLVDSMIGHTPMRAVAVRVGGREHRVLLKLEGFNGAGGSIKARTARGLLDRAAGEGVLVPGMTVVESSSGNLGVALSVQSRLRGLNAIVVADPKTTEANMEKLTKAGVRVEVVSRVDPDGSYLRSRLERVQEICREEPRALWLNQYESQANPEIHYFSTGPEIVAAAPGADAIFVACSTGGTVSGIAARVRAAGLATVVVPVDVPGSNAVRNGDGVRILPGIGSPLRSAFIRPDERRHAAVVDDREAIAACRLLDHTVDISVGGSSGAAFVAALRWLRDEPRGRTVVVVCADGGENYDFSDAALRQEGIEELPSLLHLVEDVSSREQLGSRALPFPPTHVN
ncbi:MAG TPA: pyridoxal-phosphate dependent enzyme [Solirubrobacterales bacterium]|nr:pyridoxal-phosphate dependent enzyme [Solirubrobacterales bacterium]